MSLELSQSSLKYAIRASIFDLKENPAGVSSGEESYRYFEDGLMIVSQGKIERIGDYAALWPRFDKTISIIDYRGKLLVPGFIDTHIHFPQTQIIGSYGEQLLTWLRNYTFPEEGKFKDPEYAKVMAKFFIEELFRNGSTTAMVFGTVHPHSIDILFEEAQKYNMRLVAGKVMMDRNAPEYLLDTPQQSYDDSEALINKWHDTGRFKYAITPRFAPTSSHEQLEMIGALHKKYPTTYLQTHLSENKDEITWVKELFPLQKNYLDVYHFYEIVNSRSVFGHGIYLEESEYKLLSEAGATIAFCPSSNLFLGSGLFNLAKAESHGINVSIASDVGAGTSFSMLKTLHEAYKVALLQGRKLTFIECFYMATLGNARCLQLDHLIGNFDTGKEADFMVLDLGVTPLQKLRQSRAKTLEEKLFGLLILGDERNIYATYVDGKLVYSKGEDGTAKFQS
jgi:guanine deaminase